MNVKSRDKMEFCMSFKAKPTSAVKRMSRGSIDEKRYPWVIEEISAHRSGAVLYLMGSERSARMLVPRLAEERMSMVKEQLKNIHGVC